MNSDTINSAVKDFESRKRKRLFLDGNYTTVFLMPFKFFKAFETVDQKSNSIFMPMESFAQSLNLKLLSGAVKFFFDPLP